MEFKCPACGDEFVSWVTVGYSIGGSDDEGRPLCLGEDIQQYRLHSCPKCHYAGFGWAFVGGDQPPRPGDIKAIQQALAELNKSLPKGTLWPLEKVRAAEACMLAGKVRLSHLYSFYMCGAWLSDDAGENKLAAEYRGKAWATWVRMAGLKDQLADECVAALAAVHTGRHEELLTRFKAVIVPLDAESAIAGRQAREVETAVRHRVTAIAATRPDDVPPGVLSDYDLEDLMESIEFRPTDAERNILDKSLVLDLIREVLEYGRRRAELVALGEKEALDVVVGKRFPYRREYIRLFGASKDPATINGIEGLIVSPLGPQTQPDGTPDSKWHQMQQQYARALREEWDRVRPPPAKKTQTLAELKSQLTKARTSPASGLQDSELAAAVHAIVADGTRESAAILLDDFRAHWASYLTYPLRWTPENWKTLLTDEPAAVALAWQWLKQQGDGKIKADQAIAGVFLVSQGSSAAGLEFLRLAWLAEDVSIRAAAARGLLARNDKAAAKAFLSVALESPVELENLEPELGAALVSAVDDSLVDDLLKLRRQWPGKIERKDNDKRAMAALTVRAALAKAAPKTYLPDYEKAIDELLASPIEGYEAARVPWEETMPAQMELLGWCANIHYVPYIGRLLRPMLGEALSEYGLSQTISVLARVKATELADDLATQVDRPLPLGVKLALCEAAGRLPIKGLDAAMKRWSQSINARLQNAAREGLVRLKASSTERRSHLHGGGNAPSLL